ncbi:LysR family transcriptional regulator [Streptacidiphilus jiangxiensis]|uniref:DNA-binding transcriptional regulator, LysR family n=1 Tax=Streptacidiphilus jiangxiensis TaxID=235985 RepID=A0A1H7V2E7_STRJI|nr:LysR family transcriptional regulator [Streptacidiphilus jiangxiensis]SEM03323.1 DNA-binding transcriptional regulator, LysR family [Streptacidiphilus jiangxiensis]
MGIDLRLMRYVLTVADEGGFQRAAERLQMAQPPLSRQIGALERRLGVKLFERRPVVRPTEAGRVFVESARTILADSERLLERTVLAGRGELGTVRVGYIYSAVFETVPRLVSAMRERHPGVTLEAREGWTPDLDAGLRSDTHDLVLSRDIPPRSEYVHETLRRERVVAIVDEGHPLVGHGPVALAEFAGQRFFHTPRRLAPDRHDFMADALARTGEVFEYAENPIQGLSHLDLTDRRSFTLVPASVTGRGPVGTATVPLADDLPPLRLRMVWKRAGLSPALELLLDTARGLARREGWLPAG